MMIMRPPQHGHGCARVRRLGGVGTGCIIWLCLGLWRGEQIAGFCDVLGTGTVGEQAVATDAVEAAWQHVDEEAAVSAVSTHETELAD